MFFFAAQTSDPSAAGLFDEMLLRRVGLAASPDHWHTRSYDRWRLGVLLLELVLGTRDRTILMGENGCLGEGATFVTRQKILTLSSNIY